LTRLRREVRSLKEDRDILKKQRPSSLAKASEVRLHRRGEGPPPGLEAVQTTFTCSMRRRGNCYDNAAMESWFSTLKGELGERFESARDTRGQLFEYIEGFYNQQRMHSAIGYASPAEFEKAAVVDVA
jgi:hypothetical protein